MIRGLSDFRMQIVAAANKFRFTGMSIVDVDPSLTTASISHPDLRFLANEKASLRIEWIKFLIPIKGFQYSSIRWQDDQFPMNHSSRRRIEYCTRKFTKIVESSSNVG